MVVEGGVDGDGPDAPSRIVVVGVEYHWMEMRAVRIYLSPPVFQEIILRRVWEVSGCSRCFVGGGQ